MSVPSFIETPDNIILGTSNISSVRRVSSNLLFELASGEKVSIKYNNVTDAADGYITYRDLLLDATTPQPVNRVTLSAIYPSIFDTSDLSGWPCVIVGTGFEQRLNPTILITNGTISWIMTPVVLNENNLSLLLSSQFADPSILVSGSYDIWFKDDNHSVGNEVKLINVITINSPLIGDTVLVDEHGNEIVDEHGNQITL